MKPHALSSKATPTGLSAPGLTFVGDFVAPSWCPARLDGFKATLGNDLLALNLEGPLLRDDVNAIPRSRIKYNIASALSAVSALPLERTIFCVANNHVEDFDRESRVPIAGRGLTEAGSIATPAVGVEVGEKPAIIAPLSLPSPDPGRWRRCAHSIMLSPTDALRHLGRLRQANADAMLIAYVHWGYEHQLVPFPADRAFARRALEAGADLIVGNHPHVAQPIEIMRGGTVAYSLGNFYFPDGTYFGRPCTFPVASRRSLGLRVNVSELEVLELESREEDGDVVTLSTAGVSDSPRLAEFTGLTDAQYARYFEEQKASGRAPMPIGVPVLNDYGSGGGRVAQAFFLWQDLRQGMRNLVCATRETFASGHDGGFGATERRPRVLITHQGCIPTYRAPLYDRLARVGDIEYVVACGTAPRGTGYIVAEPPYGFPSLQMTNHALRVGRTSLIWQPLVKTFWKDFDAVILGDEIKYLSHLALIAAARLRRRPALLWGFGYPEGDKEGAVPSAAGLIKRTAKAAFRKMVLRYVDGYLAYTSSGRDAVVAAGMDAQRVGMVGNTIDVEHERILKDEALSLSESDCRRRFGLPAAGPVLIYFGRLRPTKCVDLLVDYAKRCHEAGRPVFVLLSGSGETESELLAQAEGVPNVVMFKNLLGADLAVALRIATAVVSPGYAGLAIAHAFAHDLPFLTRKDLDHAPEIDYLIDGENGLLLPHNVEAFFDGLDRFLDDNALQQRLRQGAANAAERLSMDAMAATFDGLVRRLLREAGTLQNHANDPQLHPESAAHALLLKEDS